MSDEFDADEMEARLRSVIGAGAESFECGELKRTMLELADIATEFPERGHLSSRFPELWQTQARSAHFRAQNEGCISRSERKKLTNRGRAVKRAIGSRDVFDAVEDYRRTVNDLLGP